MENDYMNNTDLLEKIIKHQQNNAPTYRCQEHLLIQLCIRVNKKYRIIYRLYSVDME